MAYFSKLTAEVRDGAGNVIDSFVLYDGKKFDNFNRLHELVGRDYDDLNDDLMDGPSPDTWGMEDPMHPVYRKYEAGEVVLEIMFEYSLSYWLDLERGPGKFALRVVGSNDDVIVGDLEDVGIEEEDDDWQDKFDRYFDDQYGIKPADWTVG